MNSPQLVFLCGARDFHAIEWYRSAKELLPNYNICILTDLIAGENFEILINNKDKLNKLIIIDTLLFNYQSAIGNYWRNIIKILVFPFQVFLVKKFSGQNPEAVYFCHSMYYLVLAWASGIRYVGAPQGSDILIKPFKSRIYKYFSVKALKAAASITVDSKTMKNKIYELSGVESTIIQYGIDMKSINFLLEGNKLNSFKKDYVLSIRGFTKLYRIDEIIAARNRSRFNSEVKIYFQYPFYESKYRTISLKLTKSIDIDVGRMDLTNKYDYFFAARLVVSIPISDSSSKSVSEAIFCGCPVAITYHQYYDDLPNCMKSRVILVDLHDFNWFDKALKQADLISKTIYIPSKQAILSYDKLESFKKVTKLLFS